MSKILEVKATIIGSKPSIFRTIRLNGDTNLQIVHEVMQAVFNWGNVHMHYFRGNAGEIIKNEEQAILANTLTANTPIVYVYDYGDAWTINLELINAIEGKLNDLFMRQRQVAVHNVGKQLLAHSRRQQTG